VLKLNVLRAQKALLQSGNFVEEDPTTWKPPLPGAADIEAGKTLWYQAKLKGAPYAGAGHLNATCSGCHAQDGRDLKYFNYSNFSIVDRAKFHGLTEREGQQIASYIRTLPVAAPQRARPWNPPYQPGPGLDAKPVSEWSAGAGLEAVLDSDAQML
jgi:cytochrome c553